MLKAIIYRSKYYSLDKPTMDDIVSKARQNNGKLNVTGALCSGKGSFVQYIEGGKDDVDVIFGKINQDTRHHNIKVLGSFDINERKFKNWHMAFISLQNLTEKEIDTLLVSEDLIFDDIINILLKSVKLKQDLFPDV